jgi:hypothetical protein
MIIVVDCETKFVYPATEAACMEHNNSGRKGRIAMSGEALTFEEFLADPDKLGYR